MDTSRARVMEALLGAWREAERAWEGTDVADEETYRAASRAVVDAWLAYQERADIGAGELLLIADDARRYVAVGGEALELTGYEPSELVGRRVDDVSGPGYGDRVDEMWAAFRKAGRMDGEFRLQRKDGSSIPVVFRARYHFPIPGFHLSRIRLATD
jgi:PAS domain-containing protein